MILNTLLISILIGSIVWYSRLQMGNKMRAFLIGTDDPLFQHPRFKYLLIHLNRMSPEHRSALALDPFNKGLWEKQFMDSSDTYWAEKLNLTPEQMASVREKRGYFNNEGVWIAVPMVHSDSSTDSRSNSSSSDSSSNSDFGGGGGFDGGGAGGDF